MWAYTLKMDLNKQLLATTFLVDSKAEAGPEDTERLTKDILKKTFKI